MAYAYYVSDGYRIDYTPSGAVAAGDVIDLGTFVGIATDDIPANTLGSLAVRGIFDIVKYAGEVIAQGAPLYWDHTAKTASGYVAYNDAVIGLAAAAAASGDATVRALLCPGASIPLS